MYDKLVEPWCSRYEIFLHFYFRLEDLEDLLKAFDVIVLYHTTLTVFTNLSHKYSESIALNACLKPMS